MDIQKHYSELFRTFGDDPRAVQLTDRITQRRRFSVLCDILRDWRHDSVLDVGCGLAHLYEYLLERGYAGAYSGIDINADFIEQCRIKFPNQSFEQLDISTQAPSWQADYVLLNGVFNNPRANPSEFLHSSLRTMFSACRIGMAFNVMSTYVDHCSEDLVYFNPEDVFKFCKENLSPLVTLRHDYLVKEGVVPFEFAIMVYHTPIRPRIRLSSSSEQ